MEEYIVISVSKRSDTSIPSPFRQIITATSVNDAVERYHDRFSDMDFKILAVVHRDYSAEVIRLV